MIILKVTKNQGFILSLEDVFFGKSQEGWGVKLTPCAFHLVEIFHFLQIQSPFCLYLQKGLEFFNLILQF